MASPLFEFAAAGRLLFGPGTIKQLPDMLRSFGRRPFIVTGRSPVRLASVLDELQSAGLEHCVFQVNAEPSIQLIEQGLAELRDHGSDVVAGIGGGSAIDAAKAISALATNAGPITGYLEVIGKAQPLSRVPIPYVAVPTTCGTGSEVTRNAVLSSPEHGVKVSLRSLSMLPRVALVDPDLAATLPPAVIASTGMDALTQLIEPFVSIRANPLTDALCREQIPRVWQALPAFHDDPHDGEARADMALGAMCSGLALANAGLGAVHGLAAAIGGQFPIPHGVICAALLPAVTRQNVSALHERHPDSTALSRYGEVAQMLSGDHSAPPELVADLTTSLAQNVGIPRLGAYGVRSSDVPELVRRTAKASSTKANPIVLTEDELATAIESVL